MAFVEETRNRGHTFAKAHHHCCNFTGGFFLILGLCFIIAGGVLVSQNQAAFYQGFNDSQSKPNYGWDNDWDNDDFWDDDNWRNHNQKVV
ncbi:unnamed protein product [Dibothriocephalus latus]|uniref:Uncharacterized protein n=1 Tax=Dibothriocephalus latus TaxID=60516 RepID=A0A3P7M7C5_DIBLA|nr:unnamed protein product [Dibothriocephalus latus]